MRSKSTARRSCGCSPDAVGVKLADLPHLLKEAPAACALLFTIASGDRRDGTRVRRLPFGRVLAETHRSGGRRNGTATRWYLRRGKRREIEYVDGERHGRATAWYPNGRKRYVGQFVRDAQTGEWFYFKIDGKLDGVRTGMYENGLRYAAMKGFNDWNA